jgi:hypothetical protein
VNTITRSEGVTSRKPPNLTFERWVDRQIREAAERGEFDDLPGAGRPIPDLDRGRDELWWVKDKLRREELSVTPPTLAVRKALEDARAAIAASDDEETVRRIIDGINIQIRAVNRTAITGPPSTVMPLDVEETVARWRDRPPAG